MSTDVWHMYVYVIREALWCIYTLFFINFCHLFFFFYYFKVVIGDADLQNASPMKCHWRRGLAKCVTYEGWLETRFGKTRHLWGVIGDAFWQNASPMTSHWSHWRRGNLRLQCPHISDTNLETIFFVSNELWAASPIRVYDIMKDDTPLMHIP